jgi:hypothetical protein
MTWHCDRRISGAGVSIRYGATSPHTLGTPSQPSAGVSPAPDHNNKLNNHAGFESPNKKVKKFVQHTPAPQKSCSKNTFSKHRSIKKSFKSLHIDFTKMTISKITIL